MQDEPLDEGEINNDIEEVKIEDEVIADRECEFCHGTGVIYADEDDGEGHMMRGVREVPCFCTIDEEFNPSSND